MRSDMYVFVTDCFIWGIEVGGVDGDLQLVYRVEYHRHNA